MSSAESRVLAPGLFVYERGGSVDRATLARLPDGSVWLHAPPAWTPALDAWIRELGPLGHLVAATPRHAAALAEWVEHHPTARCWAPARLAEQVIHRGLRPPPIVPLSPEATSAWGGAIEARIATGNAHQHAIFRHIASGVLIVGRLLEARHPDAVPGLVRAVGRLTGHPPPLAHTPVDVQLHFLGQRRLLADTVRWATASAPSAVLPLRGPVVTTDTAHLLHDAFGWVGADGPIPPGLRFALGADPGGAVAFFVAAAITGGLLLGMDLPAPSAVARVVTALVVADIVGGVVAMSTPSTRAWWRGRGPAWIAGLLGIHIVHPLALVAVHGGSGAWGAGLWLMGLLGGALVWLWPHRDSAGPLAMLVVGLGAILFSADASGPGWLAGLYLLKLVGCFAVGVRADAVPPDPRPPSPARGPTA